MLRSLIIAAVGFTSLAGVASAQSGGGLPQPVNSVYYGHASTIQEGVQRGRADLVRAYGESNYWNSLAAINREQARSAYMDNKLKAVHTYFQMRAANREYVRAENPRLSPEQIERMAKTALPPRPTVSQLDPATGRINWPAALQGDEFAAHRASLDALFAERVRGNAGLGSENHAAITAIVDEMKELLGDQVARWPTGAFVAANSLLKSLSYEARFPANDAVLARGR